MSNPFTSFNVRDQFYDTGSAFKLPANFTTTTTSETIFLLSTGFPAIVSIPTGTAIAGSGGNDSPSGTAALVGVQNGIRVLQGNNNRPYFNAAQFDGRPFRVRAQGYVSGGGTTLTSTTAAIKLYLGSSATVTSNTTIAAPTAFSVGNVNGNWFFDGIFLWDSVSSTLNGSYMFNGNNNQNITNVLITQQTGLSLSSLSFLLTYTFATSSTANAIGLRSIYGELV
jgi:hypothetical protein